jgi:hypothetical protein
VLVVISERHGRRRSNACSQSDTEPADDVQKYGNATVRAAHIPKARSSRNRRVYLCSLGPGLRVKLKSRSDMAAGSVSRGAVGQWNLSFFLDCLATLEKAMLLRAVGGTTESLWTHHLIFIYAFSLVY